MFGMRKTRIMIPHYMEPETYKALRKAGVRFGRRDEEDPRFVHVTLPRGWRYVSSHSTHGTDGGLASIVDTRGRRRALTLCCVQDQPYVTSARPRYACVGDHSAKDGTTAFQVLDTAKKDKVKFTTRRHSDKEQAREDAKAWLNKHYPKWEDASAYWRGW